jgi:hypothetical protein
MANFLILVLVEGSDPDPGATAEARMLPFFAPDLTATPTAKCDSFRIGGRFDGEIRGKKQRYDNLTPDEYQARYEGVRPEDNIRAVPNVDPELFPFAVITPDGEWIDWEQKNEEEWAREFRSLLSAYRDCWAVAMDCHY